MRLLSSSLLALIVVTASPLFAQDQPAPAASPKRPTLGLVLEGGGALGLAHVGVIQWLEEHRIPVNYVAGTSMGGLVGGVYSTGIGAAGLRQLVDNINWDEVMSGQLPYPDLAFRRKEDSRDYPNSLEFGLRKGVQFPAGFNTGQQVSLIIDKATLPYSQIGSFNDLPIPFACVATNLVSGKPEIFRSGSLSTAMRATMSIPGVFTPVRGKDGTYADGGLLNNIPIDLAKTLGADIVLGVHLETAPLSPDANLSSFAVLGQSISVMIAANELRSMENADLMITVPLSKYNSMDFRAANLIIQAGYDAAAAKEKVLMAFSVDQAAWDKYLAERDARRKSLPVPEYVAVTGANAHLANQVQTRMAPIIGKPINFDELNQTVLQLNGLGRFDSVSYALTLRNGQPGITLNANEKSYAPPTVQPLILIDGSSYNNVQFNLGARITFLDIGGFRSEWRNDFILFSQYGLRSEYYHPFTPSSHWFIAPRGLVEDDPLYIYEENSEIAVFRQGTAGGGVDFGRIFGRTGELRVGYEGGWQRYQRQSGDPTLPNFSGGYGDIRIRYQMDRLDEAVLPRDGHHLAGTFKWANASPIATNQYPVLEGSSLNSFKVSEPSSILLNGYGGTTFNYATGIPQFSLGGSVLMRAYGQNELLMNEYFMGQLGYLHEFAKLPALLGGGIYGQALLEGGAVYGSPLTGLGELPNHPGDISAAVIVKSIFGPLEFGYAYGETGHHKFYLRIGRLF
jgi:NTE family protein